VCEREEGRRSLWEMSEFGWLCGCGGFAGRSWSHCGWLGRCFVLERVQKRMLSNELVTRLIMLNDKIILDICNLNFKHKAIFFN